MSTQAIGNATTAAPACQDESCLFCPGASDHHPTYGDPVCEDCARAEMNRRASETETVRRSPAVRRVPIDDTYLRSLPLSVLIAELDRRGRRAGRVVAWRVANAQ